MLKLDPSKNDRQIARPVAVSHGFVCKVRRRSPSNGSNPLEPKLPARKARGRKPKLAAANMLMRTASPVWSSTVQAIGVLNPSGSKCSASVWGCSFNNNAYAEYRAVRAPHASNSSTTQSLSSLIGASLRFPGRRP